MKKDSKSLEIRVKTFTKLLLVGIGSPFLGVPYTPKQRETSYQTKRNEYLIN